MNSMKNFQNLLKTNKKIFSRSFLKPSPKKPEVDSTGWLIEGWIKAGHRKLKKGQAGQTRKFAGQQYPKKKSEARQ